MNKIRPFLKWAGSKYRYISTILNVFPATQRLIEPFTGSGAIFLNANYPAYLLGEENADLINLFMYLQQEGTNFIEYCTNFFIEEHNIADRYYYFRQQFNQTTDLRYKAALFLYLNRHGYNGLCRYNQQGLYNVPFGRYSKPYFPLNEMQQFYCKSQQAKFIAADFRDTFSKARVGDVIYCDPPYVPLSASAKFTAYVDKLFSESDQIELAELANESALRGIPVIISNHDTAFTRYHYRHGKIISFPVKRHISCKAEHRQAAQELLAMFG